MRSTRNCRPAGWITQHVGFVTDPGRVRSPRDKPRVDRAVQFVRNGFWAGEAFADLADAQSRAGAWCTGQAGLRIHGTLQARRLEAFCDREARSAAARPRPR
jgi:transposase